MSFRRNPKEEKGTHQYRKWWVGGWIWPIGVALATLVWVALHFLLIGVRPTTWQFGTVPYIPASSVFTIETPPPGPVPNQVILPEKEPGGANATR